MVHTGLEKF